jgi:hypothetical protein
MDNSLEQEAPYMMVHGQLLPTTQSMRTVKKYDGQADALTWLETVNAFANLYGWDDEVTLTVAKFRLTGPAQRWAKRQHFTSWQDFQQQLARRFGEARGSAVARLSCCFQQPGECPKDFADRFLHAAQGAGRAEDEALVYQFLCHLLPDLRVEAARTQPRSIDEIVQFCGYWLGVADA